MNTQTPILRQTWVDGRSTYRKPPFPFIFLYGPPGAGKSALAPRLARALNMPWIDLDSVIEHRTGSTIGEIFAQSGEGLFRQFEKRVLFDVISGPSAVIALGGGTLLDEKNRQAAEALGSVICLTASQDELAHRLQDDPNSRPLLNVPVTNSSGQLENLTRLLEHRQGHYDSFPLQVDTTHTSLAVLSWKVQVCLGRFYLRGVRDTNFEGYPLLVQTGGLAEIGKYLCSLSLRGPIAVITDSNVSTLHAQQVIKEVRSEEYDTSAIIFHAGETSKSLDTIASFYQRFSETGLERRSTIVAVGGGVTLDLAGFAASTYLRGVNWVAVPTTLLAMVDASIGGKTGVDLPQGKNLVGAFYPPRLVYADPLALNTLPRRELVSGLAEVVKAGLVSDPGLFELCCQGLQPVLNQLDEVIRRSMAVKVRVVQVDPFDRGRRAALNLGHTLGHALEAASGYRLLHGEAVAIGLVLEARMAERIGLAGHGLSQQVAGCLDRLGLPTRIPAGLSLKLIVEALKLDKKRFDGNPAFALPVNPGRVKVGVSVRDWDKLIAE